jgi:hypothetical protein
MIEKDVAAIFELCSRLMDEEKYFDALHQAESVLNIVATRWMRDGEIRIR